MKKKTKDQCILESNLEKWSNEETARLAAKGNDKFCIVTYSKMNEGTIHGGDYTMKFNRDEGVIDLVINGEKNSPIWNDVIDNVPARFAQYLGNPETFVYGLSTTKSKEKWYYGFKRDGKESGTLFPIISFNEMPKTLMN